MTGPALRALTALSILALPCAHGGERPNVLLIIADDQAWGDFGFMGHPDVATPHLDRLAGEGALFRRGYVPAPLCRPSLASIVTGLYPHQHGLTGNDPPRGVDRARMLTRLRGTDPLPARLARAGYRCLQTGKWWEGHWSEGGFSEGMTHGDPARGGRHGDAGLAIGRATLAPITDFVDECSAQGTPFFVWYAPFLPHRPHDPPQRLLARYRTPQRPINLARYLAMCEWLDETVGALLDHLDERGLTDDTLVLFLSDNGWITDPETGGYAPRSKRSPYEGGVRTPILVRWPGRVAPGPREDLVSSLDLAPTVLAACGLPAEDLPGVDLVAVAAGTPPARPGVFGASFEHDVADLFHPARGLLTRWTVQGRWKLVRPANPERPSELYDVLADPWEERDVTLQNLARVAQLRHSLDRWWTPRAPLRPNLLVLVADDQRADALGCAGHPVLSTPNLDRLAARGVRFTNAFVTTSICAASRATLLTGRYERTHGYTFRTPPIAARHARESYPSLLRAAGYRTGFAGKWGVRVADGAREEMFEWVRDRGQPYLLSPGDGTGEGTGDGAGPPRHLTDRIADDAVDFLSGVEPGRPFCLSISFHAPHAEDANPAQYVWPPDLDGLYDDAPVPPPPLADPAHFAALPAFLQNSLNRVRWGWRFDDEAKRVAMTRGYWRMITGVDRALGRILAALEELGLADDTLVVFTSDNGYFLGERGFAGKWLIHDESIRVPLIVMDPGLAEPGPGEGPREGDGRELAPVVLNVDLAPTLLELAGVPVPPGYQGTSLVPWLLGERPPWRSDFLYEHHFDHPQIPRSEGVRDGRWTYVRYYDRSPPVEQLFDRQADPLEARDLAGEPDFAAVLARMRARCDELIEEL